jgi:transmembrane sensor
MARAASDAIVRELLCLMCGAVLNGGNQCDAVRAWQELRIRIATHTDSAVTTDIQPRAKKPRFRSWAVVAGQSSNRPDKRVWAVKRLGLIGIVCVIAAATLQWRPASTPVTPAAATYEMATQVGERASLRLIDGTRVTVGPQTHIRIANTFGQRTRTVYLTGEAIFDVAHTPKTPFIVKTKRSVMHVLGTRLSVRAYDTTTTVAVVNGKVSMTARGVIAPQVILTAGYVGVMAPDGVARVTANDVEQYTAWVDNRFVFRETPLVDVLDHLSRWYGVRFSGVGAALRQQRLTADWENRSLESVLRSLSLAFNIRVNRHGDEIQLSPR